MSIRKKIKKCFKSCAIIILLLISFPIYSLTSEAVLAIAEIIEAVLQSSLVVTAVWQGCKVNQEHSLLMQSIAEEVQEVNNRKIPECKVALESVRPSPVPMLINIPRASVKTTMVSFSTVPSHVCVVPDVSTKSKSKAAEAESKKELAKFIPTFAHSQEVEIALENADKRVEFLATPVNFVDECTITDIPGGIRVDTSSGIYFEMVANEPGPAHSLGAKLDARQEEETLNTLTQLQQNQDYRTEFMEKLNTAVAGLVKTNSESDLECLEARLSIIKLKEIDLPRPYKTHLDIAVDALLRHYFDPNDGSLRIHRRDNGMPKIVQQFLNNCRINRDYEELHNIDNNAPGLYRSSSLGLFEVEISDLARKIHDNQKNQQLLKFIKFCKENDFKHANHLKEANKRLKFAPELVVNKIYDDYERIYKKQTFDQYGIYKCCARDPIIKAMSIKDKKEIKRNSKSREELNRNLLVRYGLKQRMQEKWGIDGNVPDAVHDALYYLMGKDSKGLSDMRLMIDRAHECTSTYNSPSNDPILNALFLPNGVYKDFANYHRAKKLHMPKEIFLEENHTIRQMLNQLMYQEHAFAQTDIAKNAARAIDYIHIYFETKDPQLKEYYKILFQALYHSLSTGEENLSLRLPDLAVHYPNPEQRIVHAHILNMAASSVRMQLEENSKDAKTKEILERFIRSVCRAHRLNQNGDYKAADRELVHVLGFDAGPQEEIKLIRFYVPFSVEIIKADENNYFCNVPKDRYPLALITSNRKQQHEKCVGQASKKKNIQPQPGICADVKPDLPKIEADIDGKIGVPGGQDIPKPQDVPQCGNNEIDIEKDKLSSKDLVGLDIPKVEEAPQCNYSKQQNLPSLVDESAPVDNQNDVKVEDPKSKIKDIQESIPELEKEKNPSLIAALPENNAKNVEDLVKEFGQENVREAIELLKGQERYFDSKDDFIRLLEKVSRDLRKINGNERWKTFKYDPAKGGTATLGSIDEALAGIAAEEQEIINGPLVRSGHDGEEFIDRDGKCWDIKTPRSCSLNGTKIFVLEKVVNSIKKEYIRGENIILNITYLNDDDRIKLFGALEKELTDAEVARTIVVHTTDSSKSSSQFIRFMRR